MAERIGKSLKRAKDLLQGIVFLGLLGIVQPAIAEAESALQAIDYRLGKGGALVHFKANGPLVGAKIFVLKEPTRLVVDFIGTKASLRSNDIVVNDEIIERIRVGVHPDKLRLVIDSGRNTKAFDIYKGVPAPDGLYLLIGRDRKLQLTMESRPRTEPAVIPKSKPVAALVSGETLRAAKGAADNTQEGGASSERAWPEPVKDSVEPVKTSELLQGIGLPIVAAKKESEGASDAATWLKADLTGKYVWSDGSEGQFLQDYNQQSGIDATLDARKTWDDGSYFHLRGLGQSGESQGWAQGEYDSLKGFEMILDFSYWTEYYNNRDGGPN
ncbi:MAG: AMIN domain-containing protein, partial [Myxococcales bacterium]